MIWIKKYAMRFKYTWTSSNGRPSDDIFALKLVSSTKLAKKALASIDQESAKGSTLDKRQ